VPAVEARKFFEIGRFDEERLPIEYNDIDLCLRLAERGYKSVFEPRARLMHRESATRGPNPWLDSRYEAEHAPPSRSICSKSPWVEAGENG
jgi:O-antigen biosynthesis protein